VKVKSKGARPGTKKLQEKVAAIDVSPFGLPKREKISKALKGPPCQDRERRGSNGGREVMRRNVGDINAFGERPYSLEKKKNRITEERESWSKKGRG